MKASEGRMGRVFVIRLEDGDVVPDCIEDFARDKCVSVGHVIMVGGTGSGKVVVGPRVSDAMPPDPMVKRFDEAHEIMGTGILAPGEDGTHVLHMHASLGRSEDTITGCVRPGIRTWLIGEVILYEILGSDARRTVDGKTGFELLDVRKREGE